MNITEQQKVVMRLDNERTSRYSMLPGLNDLRWKLGITVAGCGAIGHQVALMLATIGVFHMTLFDPDTIEAVNLGTQGWNDSQLGLNKAQAAEWNALDRFPSANYTHIPQSYPEAMNVRPSILFVCVDTMSARRAILESEKGMPHRLIIDTRTAACAGRIIADKTPFAHWATTHYSDEDAFSAPCTLRMTAFTANIVAGLAVAQLSLYLRSPLSFQHTDILLDAISNTLTPTNLEATPNDPQDGSSPQLT